MENATKALLIAGSVLIVILLIAMGMRIFNSTSDTTKNSQAAMDTTSVMTFNSQFTGFLNVNLTSTKASTLAQKVIASNATNSAHPITFCSQNPGSIQPSAQAGTYKCTTDAKGYINTIYKSN